jgi:poly(A) polymerase
MSQAGNVFEWTVEADLRALGSQAEAAGPEQLAGALRKALVHPQRARAMRLFVDLGLAEAMLPELLPMRGLPQGLPPDEPALPPPGLPGRANGASNGDLWEHVLLVLDFLGPTPSVTLAFAALMHDIGKPRTVGRTPERYTFYSHEHVGRRMAGQICSRLQMADGERERIEWLVEKHQVLSDARQMRPGKLKLLLSHPGIHDLLALHRADALASKRGLDHVDYCERLLAEQQGST